MVIGGDQKAVPGAGDKGGKVTVGDEVAIQLEMDASEVSSQVGEGKGKVSCIVTAQCGAGAVGEVAFAEGEDVFCRRLGTGKRNIWSGNHLDRIIVSIQLTFYPQSIGTVPVCRNPAGLQFSAGAPIGWILR